MLCILLFFIVLYCVVFLLCFFVLFYFDGDLDNALTSADIPCWYFSWH